MMRLAHGARSLKAPLVSTLVLLADERIKRSTRIADFVADLHRDFADVFSDIDDATRQQIEHDYRADRGGSLLGEAFDVDEIDALNERLGDATEDELRGFLLDVQQYCTRDQPPPTA